MLKAMASAIAIRSGERSGYFTEKRAFYRHAVLLKRRFCPDLSTIVSLAQTGRRVDLRDMAVLKIVGMVVVVSLGIVVEASLGVENDI